MGSSNSLATTAAASAALTICRADHKHDQGWPWKKSCFNLAAFLAITRHFRQTDIDSQTTDTI